MAELSDPLVFSRDNALAYDQRSLMLSRRPERRRSAHVEKTHTKADAKADAKTRISATDMSRDSSKSAGAQMRSAQAHSFWSMYSPVAVHVKPMRYFTVADLACSVATILATAVTILSLVVVFANQPPGRGQPVIVSGRLGTVLGIGLKVLGHTDVYAFLGVPYARPPVGKLRFRRTYYDNDFMVHKNIMIDATMAKPACEQMARDEDPLAVMSEDCLHLNIWTTSRECVSSECANKTVLVFVHDGSFQTGGNRDPLYNGMYLSGLGDVVVVVPNYRLGALGFLNNSSHEAPGNVGLHDLLLAIQWTRSNIRRFGGNSSNLVLVGYGSGAAAVGYLLASHAVGVREADVVPRRVILMSGSPLTRYPDNTESAKRHVGEQARRMRCLTDGQPDFTCMIEANASQFVKTAVPPLFFPSFTGLVKLPPREMLHKDGIRISDVEILLGRMNDEMVHAVQTGGDSVASSNYGNVTTIELFRMLGLNSSAVHNVMAKYEEKYSWETPEVLRRVLGDLLVACPVRDFAQLLDSAGDNRVFRYLISTQFTGPAVKTGDMLRMVFGMPFLHPHEHDGMRPASEMVINLWTSFARTGTIPDINGLVFGQYAFHIARARKKYHNVLDSREEYCQLLKKLDTQ